METVAYYNGKVSEVAEMMVPLTDRGMLFGDGIYEATMAQRQKIFALPEHLARFTQNLAAVMITPTWTNEQLTTLLYELLARVDNGSYMVYWQVTRGTGPRQHQFPIDATPNLMVMITPMSMRLDRQTRDYQVRTELDVRSGLTAIKTLNLLPNVLAAQRAQAAGVDETIFYRLDNQQQAIVTEGSKTNVHLIKAGQLITSPLDQRILPGIAREHLLQAARALGMPIVERYFTIAELQQADEVFITSSTLMAGRVNELDGVPVGYQDEQRFMQLQAYLLAEWEAQTN